MAKLTKRLVDAASAGTAEHFVWCSGTPGFGVRVYPSGKKIFVAQVRIGRATRRLKIGPFGPFTVDQARTAAEEIIRDASRGIDPQRVKREAREALTVAELCDAYMEHAREGLVITRFGQAKRPSTVAVDEGRISRHIKPLIGAIPLRDLNRGDVQRMADQIAQGKTKGTFRGRKRGKAVVAGGAGTAARVVSFLGGMYTWAEKRDLVPGPNPVRGVETIRSQPRDRVLSIYELKALGEVLEKSRLSTPMPAAALKLIALTGLRREEAIGLQWAEIDETGQCLRLSETKTGKSVRPIGELAMSLLKSLPKQSARWVFPNERGTGSADLKKPIATLFDVAGLEDVRSHDLRRTFASAAADEGYSDATIAALLGHSQRSVTARHYIRRPDAALVAAADKTAARIASAMAGKAAEIVTFRQSASLKPEHILLAGQD
jgi:integrase